MRRDYCRVCICLLQEAENGIYKEVWGLFNHRDKSRSFVSHPDLGFAKVGC